MKRFTVGEHVIIRYGKHQGKKATVLANHQVDAYKVKVEDGFILFFSGKGLETERTQSVTG